MQHYLHCISAHKVQTLLHADTVTTLAFPNNLKSFPVPLCLSTLLPLYSQITAIAPTQSLHYRIKEQLEKKLYSFPLSPPYAPYRTFIPTWNPRRKLWQTHTLVSAQHILVVNQTEIDLSPSNIRGTVDFPPLISYHSPRYHYTCWYHDIETTYYHKRHRR